jgi:hypothetical protein
VHGDAAAKNPTLDAGSLLCFESAESALAVAFAGSDGVRP